MCPVDLAFKEINFPYHIVVARDGVEALDYLFGQGKHADNKPPPPMLVVLDIKLPRVNGLEVLKRIRGDARLKFLLVVILSSSNEERDKMEAEQLGAHLFLRKAVDYDEFIDVVKNIEALMAAVK